MSFTFTRLQKSEFKKKRIGNLNVTLKRTYETKLNKSIKNFKNNTSTVF